MSEPQFIELCVAGRALRIEHGWLGLEHAGAPLIVFLHEGLGSLSMWRDFPAQLCAALHCRGLVYSRPGYGRSTPRAPDEHWGVGFMHHQAHAVLPALLQALGVQEPVLLLGHSDGASIALLHAARHAQAVAALVLLAPHILVEPVSLASIRAAREAYRNTALRARLARHHADVDSAFWGWNDIWLHPDFERWDIRGELATIACPVFAIQGVDDEYGTLAQVHGIRQRVPQTQVLELPACGHSPHRDQPAALLAAVQHFITHHSRHNSTAGDTP